MIPVDPNRPYVITYTVPQKDGPSVRRMLPVLAWGDDGLPWVAADHGLVPAGQVGCYRLQPAATAITPPEAQATLTERLEQLGTDARTLWLSGASHYDVLLHAALPLRSWTNTDPDHVRLLDALARVQERLKVTTPP
ncbi:hypothetical protein ACIRPX_05165 [Streptomyces sp. NPDC101225]|uniref:hypothetical protein n=1 Tax=Streptomyces sp. NPDC101225 TaxID=3366135 RepID=UPI003800B51B